VRGRSRRGALGWHNAATVVLSISLAFVFGYALTMRIIGRGKGHAVVHSMH
jgi:hypothetical protein